MRRGTSGINCLLAIDKPRGISSHDVVNRVRRILQERRVGHAGTLDPDASGVLVVGVGQATRLLGLLTLDDKRYDARIRFGQETNTDDAEGEVVRSADVPVQLAEPVVAAAVVGSLVGTSMQVPPAYSAISIDGKRAYKMARSGDEVELPAREVSVYEAKLLGVPCADPLEWDCSFHVSKGTYIRSIARDLGRSMGTAAHLCALRRTASGPIGEDSCVTLEELEAAGAKGIEGCWLDPAQALGLARHELNDYELEALRVGRRFSYREQRSQRSQSQPVGEGDRVCLTREGLLMGVWEHHDGRLSSIATFPEGIVGVGLRGGA